MKKKESKVRKYSRLGRGEGEGWTGSLGLVDANYYIWNGQTTRSYCTAQSTQYPVINHNGKEYKKRMYTCV